MIANDSRSLFPKIVSLIILNPTRDTEYYQFQSSFPCLTSLSICYDDEISFETIFTLLKKLNGSIKRVKLIFMMNSCSHYYINSSDSPNISNQDIQRFYIDVRHSPMILLNEYCEHDNLSLLVTILHIIKSVINVRFVHIFVRMLNVAVNFNYDLWKDVFITCRSLRCIRIDNFDATQQGELVLESSNKIERHIFGDIYVIFIFYQSLDSLDI